MPRFSQTIPLLVRLTVLAVMLGLGTGLLGGLHRTLDHAAHTHALPVASDAVSGTACDADARNDEANPHTASTAPFHGSNPQDADLNHCDTCHLIASCAADRLSLSPVGLPVFLTASTALLPLASATLPASRPFVTPPLRGPPLV